MAATDNSEGMEIDSKKEIKKDFLPGYENVNSFTQVLLSDSLQAVKSWNSIDPDGDQSDYFNTFEPYRQFMRMEGKNVVNLMNATLQYLGGKGSFNGLEVEDMFDQLVNVNDAILEQAGIALDEVTGLRKPVDAVLTVRVQKPINTSWNRKSSPRVFQLLGGKNIQRPQMTFKDKINNSNNPFEPIIKYKPNSIKPLAILPEIIDGEEFFSHPYEIEIERCQPTEEHLKEKTPQFPNSVEETPFLNVQTVSELQKLLEDLRNVYEIAIDLEHHSYRSFQGITCLMQISTRSCDYIVDTLQLRSDLHILNEVFTDPKILKVLHGANHDIQWLQRDFGLYIVNLFDTGQACRVLNFPHLSLAYLMKLYCKHEPNKEIRLADWRMRPLPSEMEAYAREDTHFLLYIFDRLKMELLQNGNQNKNILHSVFQKSKEISLIRYRKPYFTDDSYLDLYRKSKKNFNNRQLFALKEIHAWRDHMARSEDESIGYILPNHMMLHVAEVLPREQQGILACCNPIPPMVRQQLNELHSIIIKAKETPADQLTNLRESTSQNQWLSKQQTDFNEDFTNCDVVDCIHDIPVQENNIGTYPTLLDNPKRNIVEINEKLLKKSGLISALSEKKSQVLLNDKMKSINEAFENIISPFQRFASLLALAPKTNIIEVSLTPNTEMPSKPEVETHSSKMQKHAETFIKEFSEEVKQTSEQNVEAINEDEELEEFKAIRKSRKRKRKHPKPTISLKIEEPSTSTSSVEKLEKHFKSFDYSATDNTVMTEETPGSSRVKRNQERNKHFNNYQNEGDTRKDVHHQTGRINRKHRKGQSANFGPKSKDNAKQKWPANK